MRALIAALCSLAALASSPALAQIAFRAANQARVAVLPPAAAPTFQAVGAITAGVGAISVPWPAHAVGDLGLLVCESAGAEAVATPAGWAVVANSPQSSIAGASSGTQVSVFWAWATTTAMANAAVADPGNHVLCRIFTYRGVNGSGNPWDVTAGGVDAMTAISLASVTTTVANTRVVQIVSQDQDSAAAFASAQTNAGLAGITERQDAGSVSGNGGGFAVWDATRAVAGAIGTTTATVTSSLNAYLTIALAPVGGVAPNFQGAGVAQTGTGAVSVPWPAHAVNDVGLLICETQSANVVATPAGGWAIVLNSPQLAAGTGGGTRLSVFWLRATGAAMANAAVADPGDHVYCRILTYRNVVAAGNPWNVTGGGIKNTISVAGVTTTVANTRVVQIVARDDDSAAAGYAGQVNAGLAGITERYDAGNVNGHGGGFVLWDATLAAAGATGNTTATVTTSVHAFLTIALPPDNGLRIYVPTGTLAGNLMVAAITVTTSAATINTPAGWTAQAAIVQGAGVTSRQQIFYRTADLSDEAAGANHFWTFSAASSGTAGGIVSYSGVDTTTPFAGFSGNTTVSGTAHTATSINTTSPNTMVISTHSYQSSQNWNPPPPGMTERVDIFSQAAAGAAGVAIAMNEVAQAAQGATGNKTATAGGSADSGITHLFALRPTLGHYRISAAATTVANCDYAEITITGHAADDSLVAPRASRIVTLSVSPASATAAWQAALVSGAGTWTPSGQTATYQWSGSEASFTVRLRQSVAATVHSVNLIDNAGTIEGVGAEDPAFTFVNSAFRISNGAGAAAAIGTQISGKPSNTGFASQSLFLQAVRTDTTTGACTTVFPSGGDVAIEVGAECVNPASCAQNVTLTTSSPAGNSGSFVPALSTSFPATINFRFTTAAAEAPFFFSYADAGDIRLQFRHVTAAPAVTVTGQSGSFVVRPFGFAFRGTNATTAIAHSNTETGGILAAAGDNFTMTLGAYRWAAGQDTTPLDGVPDTGVNIVGNLLTPNFAASTTVAVSSNLPGVATGALSRGVGCGSAATIASGSWSGGAAIIGDWCYSEAGNIFLTAASNDYLGATDADITGNSGLDGDVTAGGYVGRFRPKQFALSVGSITNRAALSCVESFTYMSERLDLGFTLTAQNTQGGTTQNYAGAYAKLDLTSIASFNLGARSGTTNLTGRIGASTPSGSWSNGVATGVAIQTSIQRAASPDGPYAGLAFGIAPSNEGVTMDVLDLDVDNNTVMDHKSIGPTTDVRFGRLRADNALASSGAIVLPVPIELQWWDTTVFKTNTDDLCTAFTPASITLTPSLSGGSTSVTSVSQSAGKGFIRLSAPGAGNTGFVQVTPDLAAGTPAKLYLQGNWTGGNWDQNPSVRGTWGLFGGQPQNFIFQRENY